MSKWEKETCHWCSKEFRSLPNHLAQEELCQQASDRGLWEQANGELEVPIAQVDMSYDTGYYDSSNNEPMDEGEIMTNSGDDFMLGEPKSGNNNSVYASYSRNGNKPEFNNDNVGEITMYIDDEVAELLLLRILQKIGAPKYTHEMIRQWGKYLHHSTADADGIKNRRSSIDYFIKKYKMTTMKPSIMEATVQLLDKGEVMKSKQKGFKKYKRCRFNPYADTRSILEDEIEQEFQDGSDSDLEEDRETPAEDTVYDSADIEPVSLEELDAVEKQGNADVPHDQHWAITTTNISVVVFPLEACIKHLLLTRRDLMKPENLVVNKKGFPDSNPFTMYNDGTGMLHEIQTGSWYRNAYTNLKINPETEFMCPIMIFIDHTITEFMGRYGLTPVVMTFTIFNEKTRRNPTAWIPLGFIPDVYKFKSKAQVTKEGTYMKGIHQMNTHRCLEKILEQLYCIQQNGGLDLFATLTGNEDGRQMRRWKFPVAVILGDTVGNDVLCGRFVYYGIQAARINRACDCPGCESNDPDWECKWILQAEVEALMAETEEDRKDMSQHFIKNAFHRIDFGGDLHGIHGCTPVDIMHTLLHGIYKYSMETFFLITGADSVTIIDDLVKDLGRQPRCRGRDQYQRVYFGKGISNLTQTTAMENSGAVMMLTFALLTTDGQATFRNRNESLGGESNDRFVYIADYIQLFEMLLCYEQWTRLDTMWHRENHGAAKDAESAIRTFLKFVKATANRTKGQGWSLSKYHEMLHVVWCITRYASCRNFDSAIGETNHKWIAKAPAKTAQKNHKTFEIQSAENLFDQYVISRAMHEFLQMGAIDEEFKRFFPADLPKADPVADDDVQDAQDAPLQQRGSEFVIEQQAIPNHDFCFYILTNKHNRLISYLDYNARLTELMYKTYIEGYPERTLDHPHYDPTDKDRVYKDKVNIMLPRRTNVQFVSEYKHTPTRLYRGHPAYQSRAPWYDWVNIRTKENAYPCQVYMFVKWFSEEKQSYVTEALIRRAAEPPSGGTVLTEEFHLETFKKSDHTSGLCTQADIFLPRYRFVDATMLQEQIYCVSDICNENQDQERVFLVHPLNTWGKEFHDPTAVPE